jgi:hypothetical protein
MKIHGLGAYMRSDCSSEHKGGLHPFIVCPALPAFPGLQALFCLFCAAADQQIHNRGGGLQYTDFVIFQRGKYKSAVREGAFWSCLDTITVPA